MRILKFVSKISLNLAELINSGIVSYKIYGRKPSGLPLG